MKLLVAVAVTGVLTGWGGSTSLPRARLSREPYLGLACQTTAWPCRRLGLAIWLTRPASSVSAVVDHRNVSLRTAPGQGAYRHGLFWQGFFADARAEQLADAHRRLAVRVRIVSRPGAVLFAEGSAVVSSGYG